MRHRRLARWLGLGAVLAALAVGGNVVGHYTGLVVRQSTPAELSAVLSPWYRVAKPEGPGPFPTALLYSGCDGPRDSMDRWSAALVSHGWASIIVDSHTPRGLDDLERWRLVCAGQVLMGSERAGDVLVSLADARRMDFVDPTRLVLLGASHGGWAIMDLLALDPPAALPFNLSAAPDSGDPLRGLAGVVLLYPYCGEASRANPDGWRRPVPTLLVMAGEDSIVDPADCAAIAARMAARGSPIESLTLAGADHGFDQQDKAALSTLEFDPKATAAAIDAAFAFLDALPPAR
ncbi:MAG: dienelactone hydrolase family protein [Amaricoccus sp.]|uniref:dienelactone hydrolase family protein n=1 Tax=Amaricoccus sp. TaxID=1872485 RepID=UPI0039E52E91